MCVFWLVLCAFSVDNQTAEKPLALQAFEQARQAIAFADVHWSQCLPLRESNTEEWHVRSLIARDEVAVMILGTPSGITAWREDKTPILNSPPAFLKEDDGWWDYRMDQTDVYRYEGHPSTLSLANVHSMGMTPFISLGHPPEEAIEDMLSKRCGPVRYREEVVDGLHRVEAQCENEDTRFVWYIDPDLGWNATRAEYWYGDSLQYETLTEYEEINGVFFPVSSAHINADGDMYALQTVHEAEVNTPELPRDLVPEHIGIETGMFVFVQNNPEVKTQHNYVGDGKTLPAKEFWEKVRKGEIELGPKTQADLAGRPVPHSVPDPKEVRRQIEELRKRTFQERALDEWEKYTLAFIRRHELDDEQQQKAMQILRMCQLERDHYLRGKRRKLEAAEAEVKNAADQRARQQAEEKIQTLRAPIGRIFENKLKPRLDRLLTRAQRKQAAQTSQPSAPGD